MSRFDFSEPFDDFLFAPSRSVTVSALLKGRGKALEQPPRRADSPMSGHFAIFVEMSDGYNFQQLKAEILSRSRATDWKTAKSEWYLVSISEAEASETCLCSHFPIIELCTIANHITSVHVDVGNVCVKRFLGFRSDLIFASIKRIRADVTKSAGADATVLFHERGIINAWEYGF